LSKTKIYWRVNQGIHAPKVRVIDEKGKQVGVLSVPEALKKAKKAELDLVEIAPKAKPPVTKIIDFGKFKYQEEKRLKKAKIRAKAAEVKEIRFSPFIGEADYNTRLERVNEFLGDGDKARLVVKFKGRQMGSKQFGYNLLKRVLEEVKTEVNIDMEPKFLGRHLVMVISPMSKNKTKNENKTKIKNKKKPDKKA